MQMPVDVLTLALSSKYYDMPDKRLFLLMRNTTYYTEKQLVRRKTVYTINKYLHICYLFVSALLNRRMRSFKIFNFAVQKGSSADFAYAHIPKP